MIIGRKQLAELLGLTEGRIQQLTAEGMPKEARGKYNAPACIRWYIEARINSAAGPAASADVNEARKKLYDAQVVKTKLETSKIKRETIPADEHLIDMNQLAVLFASGLDAISGRLAAELAGMTDPAEISERLSDESNAIRESVADAIQSYSRTVSHS